MKYLVTINKSTIKENPSSNSNCYYRFLGPLETIVENTEDGFVIKQSQPYEKLYTLSPAPKYLFEYNPTLVKCESCNIWFEHTKLKSDSNEDSDYNYYFSDTVCPYCGEWDCCQIEYEKIQ